MKKRNPFTIRLTVAGQREIDGRAKRDGNSESNLRRRAAMIKRVKRAYWFKDGLKGGSDA